MNDPKRRKLLDQVQRSSQTIGEEIPDELVIEGRTIELKELVFECKRLGTVSEEDRERIEELKRDLQRERLKRKQTIESGDISQTEGEQLVRSIHGIDRAVNALDSIDSPSIGEQLNRKQIDDAEDLLTLIDQATM